MAKQFFAAFLTKLWKADIDVETSTIKVQLLDADYVFSSAHDFLDDIPAGARIGTAQEITSKTFGVVAAGVLDGADITHPAIAAGDTITQYVIYNDTPATDATKDLILWCDEQADASPLSIETNDEAIVQSWSVLGIGKI